MIVKREFFKWRRVKLIDDKTYPHISFVTAWYFLGIPLYSYEKYYPNKIDQFDIEEESGYVETRPAKKTGAYDPLKDEAKKLEGDLENSFE